MSDMQDKVKLTSGDTAQEPQSTLERMSVGVSTAVDGTGDALIVLTADEDNTGRTQRKVRDIGSLFRNRNIL